MTKHFLDFKLKVIEFYLEGNGYDRTAEHFKLGHSVVRRWIKRYQYHGIDGIKGKSSQRRYTLEFKWQVLTHMVDNHLSTEETAAFFNIPTSTTVLRWKTLYKRYGKIALLPRKKGQPIQMNTPKEMTSKIDANKTKKELLEELAYLRAENDVLKKYQEIALEERQQRRKRK